MADWRTNSLLRSLTGHDAAVYSVGMDQDGRLVVCAGYDAAVRVWNWRARRLLAVLRDHEGSVYGAAFSRDGRYIVTAGLDGTVRVWDWRAGTPLALPGTRGRAVFQSRRTVRGGRDQ